MIELTQEGLKQVLNYDPLSGVFTWKNPKQKGLNTTTTRAGTQKVSGYRNIQIDNRMYREHRLAWLYVYGILPTKSLDHINGIKNDNRITNLREATPRQNNLNKGVSPRSTTGFKGVSRTNNGFRVRISIGERKYKEMGYYQTPEIAYKVYCGVAKEIHGEFFNGG